MPIWSQIPGKVGYPFVLNDASPQADGLVGWWPGTGAGGKLWDMSGRGNNGTLTNFAAPFTATSGWAAGVDGGKGAIVTDGTDDCVVLPATSLFNFGTRDFSLFTWVKPTSIGTPFKVLIGKDNASFRDWQLSLSLTSGASETSGYLCFFSQAGSGGPSFDSGAAVMVAGQWQHVGMTKSGSTWRLFRNGQTVGSGSTSSGADYVGTGAINFARREYSGFENYYTGGMEDTRIYNRGLSVSEVAALYDPRTRWELRYAPGRVAYFIPGASGGASYTLTAALGTYTYTGIAAALKASRQLAASQGSYTLTGIAAALIAARKIVGDAGGYTLTGIAATLNKGFYLTAGTGSYTLTGIVAALIAARKLAAETGTYTLTGIDVTLNKGFYLTAAAGSYALSGQDAGLRIARVIVGANGSYTLTGNVATISRGFRLAAETGSITLTGRSAALLVARMLAAGVGSYVVTGNAASIVYSGAGTVEIIITATGYAWTVIDATGHAWTEIDDTE